MNPLGRRDSEAGDPQQFPSTKEKVKIFKWKKLCPSPPVSCKLTYLTFIFIKTAPYKVRKELFSGCFFMYHFLKHILQSCCIKQRYLRCTRNVFLFCNRCLAVTNKFVTVLWLLCNRCVAVTNFYTFGIFLLSTPNLMINENCWGSPASLSLRPRGFNVFL